MSIARYLRLVRTACGLVWLAIWHPRSFEQAVLDIFDGVHRRNTDMRRRLGL